MLGNLSSYLNIINFNNIGFDALKNEITNNKITAKKIYENIKL